jgi:DNA (cytosine-5)-methyltransferase 1
MSGHAGHRKRLICVNDADIREKHFCLAGHIDFFPADSFGPSSRKKGSGQLIHLDVDGLPEPVMTDIPTESKTGQPLQFFRQNDWVREFFKKHNIKHGDTIVIERISSHRYSISLFDAKPDREHPRTIAAWDMEPQGKGPTVIELFAGCGGMALGFKNAGFRTVLANEWDKNSCDTIRANISDRVLNCAIQEVEKFPAADVVAGGPPCQGFSNLGDRVPNDPRNQLWRQYLRCVEQVRPKIFVLENVPPILRSAEYEELKRLAESYGYHVEGRVLNAADYGVPQTRKRAIVIGSLLGKPSFPNPTHIDPRILDKSPNQKKLKTWRTVRDAIGNLPIIPTGINWHIGRNPKPISIERYHYIKEGGNRWQLPPHLTPPCWKRKTQGGTDLFGRLWWDRPSVTIRTEFYKPEKGRYLHPVAHRPITHLEAALLQSFPDDYIWCGTKSGVGIQIGNAVPPLLGQAIAKHIANLLCDRTARV